jgi:CubicO group peptidase (beta-lactamase class C family)
MKTQYLLLASILLLFIACKNLESARNPSSSLRQQIVENEYPNIDGVIVSQHGAIIIEEYFNGFKRSTKHQTRSSFKSITSLLVGIAVDQNLFAVEDEIGQYIIEWKNDPRAKITIKDLLEMKSGLACENFFDRGPDCETEMYDSEDWLAYILDIPLRYEPGLEWEYTSMEPELLGIIISRTSNMTLMEFADKFLFEPIGIKQIEWEITPDGRGYAAGSSSMKPSDMLKIAQLVKCKGNWLGRQIISEKWIKESTRCETIVDMSFLFWSGMENTIYASARYGYLWYKELLEYEDIRTEVLFASGNGGQYMMVLEDYDAVIVFTGSNYGNWRGKLPFEILLKYIVPVLESGML